MNCVRTRGEQKAYANGQKEGRRWARYQAEPEELRLLADHESKAESWENENGETVHNGYTLRCPGCGKILHWADDGDHPDDIADELYFIMHPDDNDDRETVVAFWEDVLGEYGTQRLENDEFAGGFVDGAIEHWKRMCRK